MVEADAAVTAAAMRTAGESMAAGGGEEERLGGWARPAIGMHILKGRRYAFEELICGQLMS